MRNGRVNIRAKRRFFATCRVSLQNGIYTGYDERRQVPPYVGADIEPVYPLQHFRRPGNMGRCGEEVEGGCPSLEWQRLGIRKCLYHLLRPPPLGCW